jgi:hypothetical protein
MGYDLHITRRANWSDNGNDIAVYEWIEIVKNDSELQLKPENGPYFAVWSGKSTLQEPWLDWSRGQIQTKNPDDALIDKMVSIAGKLHAVVQGDDGEIYKSHVDAHRTRNGPRIATGRHKPLKILGLIILFCLCIFLGFNISYEYLDFTISILIGIVFAIIITFTWVFVLVSKRKSASKIIMKDYHSTGEILTSDQMKQKYGLTIENYKPVHLNPENIPEEIRDLTSLAEKWGIGDDVIRNDMHFKVSDDEKQALKSTLNGRTQFINQWLDSFVNGKMSNEAAAFMYMLEGFDEMNIQINPTNDLHK